MQYQSATMDGYIAKSLLCVVFCYLVNLTYGVEQSAEKCENFKFKNNVHSCCTFPTPKEPELTSSLEISEGCVSTILENKTLPTEIEARTEKIECLEECVFNGKNWLTPDKKINPEATMEGFHLMFSADEWKELIQNTIRDCIKNNVASTVKENAKCKSGAFQLVQCFTRELYLNCPDNSWQSSKEECNEAKDFVRNCQPLFTAA